jgi:hypothetical protein
MKSKKVTKNRKQERDFEVANNDIKSEFESTFNDMEVLDEEALIECLIMEEDE